MARVFFLGEGEQDVGAPGASRRPGDDHEGDIPRLVRRLVEVAGGKGKFGYDAATIDEAAGGLRGVSGRAGRKSKRVVDAISAVLARTEPLLGVCALIDARPAELQNLRADFRLATPRLSSLRPVPICIGIAVHEIEAWMLADPESRRAAFGSIPTFDKPEDEPDPRGRWSALAGVPSPPAGLSAGRWADAQRRAAWDSLRPHVVRAVCPVGFAVFEGDVSPLLELLR